MSNRVHDDLDGTLQALRAAADRQRLEPRPTHDVLYAWGSALAEVTALLEHIGRVLGRQVAAYGDRRVLRDDAGPDPYARLQEACGHLGDFTEAVAAANVAAQRYHSAIGHVGVEVDLEGK